MLKTIPVFYMVFLVVSADVCVGNEREPDYEEETIESAAEAECYDRRKKKAVWYP